MHAPVQTNAGMPRRLLHPMDEARELLGRPSRSLLYRVLKEAGVRPTKMGNRSFLTDGQIQRILTYLAGDDHA